jgi:hypothetical protein
VSVISRDGDRAFPLLAGGRAVSARAVQIPMIPRSHSDAMPRGVPI